MTHLDDLALSRALDVHDPHLDTCSGCRARFEHLRRVAAGLASLPTSAPSNMAAEVVRRITATRDRGGRRMALGMLIGAAGAVIAMVVASPSEPSTFTARGGADGAPIEVATFIANGSDARVPLTHDVVATPGFTLSFRAVRRVSTDRAPRHLMVFGCDAAGELHWAVPAWDDATQDPTGLLLTDAPLTEIPTALQPEAPPGPFTVVTLTTTAPIGVHRVESLVTRCRSNALSTLPGATLTETAFSIR